MEQSMAVKIRYCQYKKSKKKMLGEKQNSILLIFLILLGLLLQGSTVSKDVR